MPGSPCFAPPDRDGTADFVRLENKFAAEPLCVNVAGEAVLLRRFTRLYETQRPAAIEPAKIADELGVADSRLVLTIRNLRKAGHPAEDC
jgi:hypothetical protein